MSKSATVDKLVATLGKRYGTNSIYALANAKKYDVVSTGSLSLDYALGIGGLPLGRVVGAYGPPNGGKTTLACHIANNYLKAYPDKIVVFHDLEHKLEYDWAANFIEDMDRVLVTSPDHVQQMTNIFREIAQDESASLQVIDSIGGAPTAQSFDFERSAEKANFGGNSGAVTDFAKHAQVLSGKYGFTTLGLNQARQNMNGGFVPNEPGGMGWQHACSVRLLVAPAPKKGGENEAYEKINGEEMRVGYKVSAKVVKSSVGPVGRVATYWFYNVKNSLGFGIDYVDEVVNLSTLTEVVRSSGAWVYHDLFPEGKLNGKKKMRDFLAEHDEVKTALFQETMNKMKSGAIDMSAIIPTEDPDKALPADGDETVLTIDKIKSQLNG